MTSDQAIFLRHSIKMTNNQRKIEKLYGMKISKSVHQRNSIKNSEKIAWRTGKISANHVFNIGLISRISKTSCMHASLLQFCPTLCDPMDCSQPGSPSTGFSRQEYWSRLSCPVPGDLPDPRIKPVSVSCIGRWVLYHQRHLGIQTIKDLLQLNNKTTNKPVFHMCKGHEYT